MEWAAWCPFSSLQVLQAQGTPALWAIGHPAQLTPQPPYVAFGRVLRLLLAMLRWGLLWGLRKGDGALTPVGKQENCAELQAHVLLLLLLALLILLLLLLLLLLALILPLLLLLLLLLVLHHPAEVRVAACLFLAVAAVGCCCQRHRLLLLLVQLVGVVVAVTAGPAPPKLDSVLYVMQ